MRSQGIRHSFFGASQFIFHAYYQTDGKSGDLTLYCNPRFDFAPGLNYEPWFKQYPLFAAENQALTNLIQNSDPQPRIAVLFPLLTWWAEELGHAFSSESGYWFRFLLENNYSFDLISQEQFDSACVEQGCLRIGKETYQTLIFPAVTVLTSIDAVEKITQFTASGGNFIASAELPYITREEGRDDKLRFIFNELIKASDHAAFIQHLPEDEELKRILLQIGTGTIKLRGSKNQRVWGWQGKRGENTLFLCFNDSPEPDRITLSVDGFSGQPYLLDILHSSESPWLWYEPTAKGLDIHFDAEAGALFGFVLKNESQKPAHLVETDGKVRRIEVTQSGRSEFTIEMDPGKRMTSLVVSPYKPVVDLPNVFIEPVQSSDKWKVTAEAIQPAQPLDLTDWTLEVPDRNYRSTIKLDQGWEQQGLPDFAGEGVYRCIFNISKLEAERTAVLSLPRVETTAEAWLNGHRLGELGWPPYHWQIPTGWLSLGRNELEIKVSNTSANYYYAGTPFQPEGKTPSGLIGNPRIEFIQLVKLVCRE